jgi:hypothetical protein
VDVLLAFGGREDVRDRVLGTEEHGRIGSLSELGRSTSVPYRGSECD